MFTARPEFKLSLHKVDLSAYASFTQTCPEEAGTACAPSQAAPLSLSDLLPHPDVSAAGSSGISAATGPAGRTRARSTDCALSPAARPGPYAPGHWWQSLQTLQDLYQGAAQRPAAAAPANQTAAAADGSRKSAAQERAAAAALSAPASAAERCAWGSGFEGLTGADLTAAAGAAQESMGAAGARHRAASAGAAVLEQGRAALSDRTGQRADGMTLPEPDAMLMARVASAIEAAHERHRRISASLAAEVGAYLDFLASPAPDAADAAAPAAATGHAGGAAALAVAAAAATASAGAGPARAAMPAAQ